MSLMLIHRGCANDCKVYHCNSQTEIDFTIKEQEELREKETYDNSEHKKVNARLGVGFYCYISYTPLTTYLW